MSDNPFRRYAALGYPRLVPIIPPTAPISERSSLFDRVGTTQDARGKSPGVKGRDGNWRGFDWIPHEADERDYGRWHAMGAGVGVRTGAGLVAIDADTLDEACAIIVRDAIREAIGETPIRVGRSPKALYLVRCDLPVQYQRIEFGPLTDKGNRAWRVELLTDSRQFVAEGIHPQTGRPYHWPKPIVPFAQLPAVQPGDLTALLTTLSGRLPDCGPVKKEGGAASVDQASLRGDPATVRKAVAAIPNASEHFPSRESYLAIGFAIKAAVADETEALDIFEDWCARWTDGENDPDVVRADWSRMKGPFRRGARWLYEQAEALGNGAFSIGEVWLDNLDAPANPFAALEVVTATEAHTQNSVPEPIKWVRPREWEGVEPPEREWDVVGWVPRYEVTLLYGDGGIGKTLAVHQLATAFAAGVPWLGQETKRRRVMCFFCEDSSEELLRRQIDINRALGVTWAEIDERLRIASRKYLDNLFILWDRHTGAMKRQAVWQQLLDDARAFGAEVLIVDTIADTYGGSEIDRGQVNAFVKSCLGRLAKEINGSVIALGHPSLSGKTSGSGTSGSTAWSNAVRSRMYLRYPKGVDKGNIREIEGMKLNYGPKGALLKLRWEAGAFSLMASSTPAGAGAAGATGEAAGRRPPAGSVEGAARDAVIAALQCSSDVRMSLSPQSQHFAARVLKRLEPEILEAVSAGEIEEALSRLEREGAISAVKIGMDVSRRPIYGLRYVDTVSDHVDIFS
jgi:hypothetical protein